MRTGPLLGLLLILLAGVCAHAEDDPRAMSQYIHDAWGSSGGFLGGDIYAIGQSADGYLWIGTARGLVRFDGSDFRLIQRPVPDLPPIGAVRALLTDAEGSLWILLEGPHMLRYRDGTFEDVFARFDLPGVTFTAMALDSDRNLLAAELGGRILRYRNGRFETVLSADKVPGTVTCMAETRDRSLWMGTEDDALFRMSGSPNASVIRVSAVTHVTSLLSATNGGVWIGTDRGVHWFDVVGAAKPITPAAMNIFRVFAMTRDLNQNIWLATDQGRIRIDRAGVLAHDAVQRGSTPEVEAIYCDREGDLWSGGARGIERLRGGKFKTYTRAEGLPSDANGPVYADSDGRTWFAPLTGGLYVLQGDRVTPVTAGGLDQDVVYSISGGAGEIWLGRQRGGLTRLTTSESRSGSPFAERTYTTANGLSQNSVYAVHRSANGTVWAGTVSGGLSRFKNGAFKNYSTRDGLPSNTINSIAEMGEGAMWFATPNGLCSLSGDGPISRVTREGLPSPNVTSLFADSAGVLWVGTASGLAIVTGHGAEPVPGLPEPLREQVLGIAEDPSGSLWFSTSDHVLRLDRGRLLQGRLKDADVESYTAADGLLGTQGVVRERSVVSGTKGQIWFSLNRGLAVAESRLAPKDAAPVTVRIDAMFAGGVRLDPFAAPRIAGGKGAIAFNYSIAGLSPSERRRFRYRLDGSGDDWSDMVAARQVVYSNLGPGSYRFLVTASNSEGLWNSPETAVPFVIEPAFWQTWWFRIACVLACILAFIGLYRLRTYRLTQQLNARFQERLAERTRIAQELHDTLLQGVLSASMQLDLAEDQLSDDSPAKPLLRRVLQLMGQVTQEGRNVLQGLRRSGESDHSLELAFSRIRQEYDLEEKVGYRVIGPAVIRPLRPLVRDEVYRIGREALVNAFLHARAHSIEVEVEYASKYLRVLVRDDGSGIDPAVLVTGRAGHWGLAGMRERSESIGASFKLRSRTGAGTEVEVTVPGELAFQEPSRGSISRVLPWLNRESFERHQKSEPRQGETREP